MIGRHPDRWRLDAVGNPVIKALTSCNGPLCYQYDHIVPFSKGGETVVENCQLLQSQVNKHKSNKIEVSHGDLRNASPKIDFKDQEFDNVEKAIYGDILKIDVRQQQNIQFQQKITLKKQEQK